VAVEDITVATLLLNLTMLLVLERLNLVPVIVTDDPTLPLVGLKSVITGGTIKLFPDMVVRPFTVIVIFPVVAASGTVIDSEVFVASAIVQATLLMKMEFSDFTLLKFFPVIVTEMPGKPLVGAKLVISGELLTVKSEDEVAVLLFTVTVIFPVEALAGTDVIKVV